MALVCDIKSNTSQEDPTEKVDPLDLEDGEIEDDEEEDAPAAMPPEEPAPPIAMEAVEEPPIANPAAVPEVTVPQQLLLLQQQQQQPEAVPANEKDKDKRRDRSERVEKRKHDDKGKKHMTEAEKSILHLRKREEMQRKKWEKMRNKEALIESIDDDFAKNIEKTLATILNKKEKEAAALASGLSGEDVEKERDKGEEKRGKKRRKMEKDRKNKQRRAESPKSEIDENEMVNMRGGSPSMEERLNDNLLLLPPPGHSEDNNSYESEYSDDQARTEEKDRERDGKKKKRKRNKDRSRMKSRKSDPLKDSQGVCVFYLQGKCQKNDCPYSHEAVPPMKLELCKFYLMDCCAKGDKCSYMHSEFPCKFYHTGLNCAQGDDCKFAHGKPLSESLKQILFKHIETAPREILGGFPRMSQEEALNMINVTQAKLREEHGQGPEIKQEVKGGIPSLFDINVPVPPELLQGCDDSKNKMDKVNRNRMSRWQEPESSLMGKEFPLKPFNYGQDQDMRINSNGDVDMRTLPPSLSNLNAQKLSMKPESNQDLDLERYKREAGLLLDSDIRSTTGMLPFPSATKDIDIRQSPLLATKDIDIRQQIPGFGNPPPPIIINNNNSADNDTEDEPMLQIDTGEDKKEEMSIPADLPKMQRELFMRIQAHQRDDVVESDNKRGFEMDENINWYSDDDDEDDNRLTIKVDNEDAKDVKEEAPEPAESSYFSSSPVAIKPQDVVEKLGDLSKIDISAEVTKLLTSMSQGRNQFPFAAKPSTQTAAPTAVPSNSTPPRTSSDPRISRQDPRLTQEKGDSPRTDPRLSADPRQRPRQSSTEFIIKTEKVTIYEQGGFDRNVSPSDDDIDIRGLRSDVDLRNLQLPFKGMQNYTPASEIDASISSHPPITWRLAIAEIPRPDYTGLKLSVNDAEKTGDPRLRKIFRLSTEERDTPLSPKAGPTSGTSISTATTTTTTVTVRVDPRLRKTEEPKADPSVLPPSLNYTQQITMLRNSAFYQSLTSQQKVLLNHELSLRNDSTNTHDPVLNNLLSNLDIIPGANVQSPHSLNTALSILNNASSKGGNHPNHPPMNAPPMVPPMGPNIHQPGLLGAAPGIPNLPGDFPINFDPRNGGLLGNAPMPPFGAFPPPGDGPNFNNYNEDFYPPDNQGGGGFQGGPPNQRDNRGFNRDRRRGRNNYHTRHNGNRNFRNNRHNRSNRTNSPP